MANNLMRKYLDSQLKEIQKSKKNLQQTVESFKQETKKELAPAIKELEKSAKILPTAVSAVLTKMYNEEDRILEIIRRAEHEQYLSINHITDTKNTATEKDVYRVYDSSHNLKYLVEGGILFGHHRLKIYSCGQEIGTVKRSLIPLPLNINELEIGVRKSKISIIGNKMFYIRGHKDSGELCCAIKRKYWKITHRKTDDNYSIYYKKKVIAKIYKPFKSSEHSNDNWVLGYDDVDREVDVVVTAVSLWNMVRD